MPITWRTELYFSCDNKIYNPDCEKELSLDQLNAKTKKGMFAIAKKRGWISVAGECFCPSCFAMLTKGEIQLQWKEVIS